MTEPFANFEKVCVALCSEEYGGEHQIVHASEWQLRDLGLYPTDCEYDDGIPTWQGPTVAITRAFELYGKRK